MSNKKTKTQWNLHTWEEVKKQSKQRQQRGVLQQKKWEAIKQGNMEKIQGRINETIRWSEPNGA